MELFFLRFSKPLFHADSYDVSAGDKCTTKRISASISCLCACTELVIPLWSEIDLLLQAMGVLVQGSVCDEVLCWQVLMRSEKEARGKKFETPEGWTWWCHTAEKLEEFRSISRGLWCFILCHSEWHAHGNSSQVHADRWHAWPKGKTRL